MPLVFYFQSTQYMIRVIASLSSICGILVLLSSNTICFSCPSIILHGMERWQWLTMPHSLDQMPLVQFLWNKCELGHSLQWETKEHVWVKEAWIRHGQYDCKCHNCHESCKVDWWYIRTWYKGLIEVTYNRMHKGPSFDCANSKVKAKPALKWSCELCTTSESEASPKVKMGGCAKSKWNQP